MEGDGAGVGVRAGLLSLPVSFAAYLLFAGTLSLGEIVTGAVLSAISAAAAVLLSRLSGRHFAFSIEHLRVWGRALRGVPVATARTGMALAASLHQTKVSPGRADVRPFRPGRTEAPADRARRVTAVLATSLAPSTFVLNVPLQRQEALLHGIGKEPPHTDPEWLT